MANHKAVTPPPDLNGVARLAEYRVKYSKNADDLLLASAFLWLLNTRSSLTDLVPVSHVLCGINLVDGLWCAVICHRIVTENTTIGTGPTPELAIADAASKVQS